MHYNDLIGTLGVGLILLAYLLHTFHWLRKGRLYYALNLLGAGLACYASWLIRYWPFVVLEGVWCIVSAVGLLRYPSMKKPPNRVNH
jgi:multisubunit Na+/H+ antiporter MnhG subunit